MCQGEKPQEAVVARPIETRRPRTCWTCRKVDFQRIHAVVESNDILEIRTSFRGECLLPVGDSGRPLDRFVCLSVKIRRSVLLVNHEPAENFISLIC
jgi:hypothetical protein